MPAPTRMQTEGSLKPNKQGHAAIHYQKKEGEGRCSRTLNEDEEDSGKLKGQQGAGEQEVNAEPNLLLFISMLEIMISIPCRCFSQVVSVKTQARSNWQPCFVRITLCVHSTHCTHSERAR